MKTFYFLGFVVLLVLFGCYPSTLGIFPVKPVVEVNTDTTMIVSVVPEGDQSGWQAWDSGRDTFSLEFTIKETKGHSFYITNFKVELYDNEYMEAKEEKDYTKDVIIDEGDASDLEDADPNDREGYLKITISYYDEYGESYSSLPAFRKIKVNHPE